MVKLCNGDHVNKKVWGALALLAAVAQEEAAVECRTTEQCDMGVDWGRLAGALPLLTDTDLFGRLQVGTVLVMNQEWLASTVEVRGHPARFLLCSDSCLALITGTDVEACP